jgi:hypothetical protein
MTAPVAAPFPLTAVITIVSQKESRHGHDK